MDLVKGPTEPREQRYRKSSGELSSPQQINILGLTHQPGNEKIVLTLEAQYSGLCQGMIQIVHHETRDFVGLRWWWRWEQLERNSNNSAVINVPVSSRIIFTQTTIGDAHLTDTADIYTTVPTELKLRSTVDVRILRLSADHDGSVW